MAARILAAHGCRVVVLECGRPTKLGATFDRDQADRERAFVRTDSGTRQPIGDPWTASGVGGGMEFYDGISFRYQPVDFDPSAHIRSDLDPRWPIGPAMLAPHYRAVEHLVGIAGDAATARATGIDEPLPLPAHRPAKRASVLSAAAGRLGLSPFPVPIAINSRNRHGRPNCDSSKRMRRSALPEPREGERDGSSTPCAVAQRPRSNRLARERIGRSVDPDLRRPGRWCRIRRSPIPGRAERCMPGW